MYPLKVFYLKSDEIKENHLPIDAKDIGEMGYTDDSHGLYMNLEDFQFPDGTSDGVYNLVVGDEADFTFRVFRGKLLPLIKQTHLFSSFGNLKNIIVLKHYNTNINVLWLATISIYPGPPRPNQDSK